MKKTLKVLGIIALVAVIWFSMAACGEDPGPGGSTDIYTEEQVEATTTGRLTITGLGSYNGKKIWANVNWQEGTGEAYQIKTLDAYQTAYNRYVYRNGNLESTNPGDVVEGTISGGQVTLKVFLYNPNVAFENYAGNEQGVVISAYIFDDGSSDGVVGGNVFSNVENSTRVNFTNGIGSGIFRLNP